MVPDPRWLVKRGHSSIEGRCAAFVHLWGVGTEKAFRIRRPPSPSHWPAPAKQAMTHAMLFTITSETATMHDDWMPSMGQHHRMIEHSITLQYMKISSTDYYHSMAPLSLSHDSPVIASFLARPITCSSQGQRRCDSSRFV